MLKLIALGGAATLTILIFQILVGFKIVKIDFKYHKNIAIALLIFALAHGTAALIYIFG